MLAKVEWIYGCDVFLSVILCTVKYNLLRFFSAPSKQFYDSTIAAKLHDINAKPSGHIFILALIVWFFFSMLLYFVISRFKYFFPIIPLNRKRWDVFFSLVPLLADVIKSIC